MTNQPASGTGGRIKEIESTANPIIKDLKALEKKRVREETGTFLAEGLKLLIDALESGWKIRTLVVSKQARSQPQVEQFAARCVAAGTDMLIVSNKVLQSITRRDNPQMVCGVVAQRLGSLAQVARDLEPNSLWVALDRVRDPGNLGTVIRTADALGAKGIILIGDTTDPFATETVRATMGSVFSVPVIAATEAEFLAFADQYEGRIIGTHLQGSVDFRVPEHGTTASVLLMGNEQAGLPETLVSACDQLVRIPQAGRADSLNLAIATGICLFQMRSHALPIIEGAPQ